MIEKILQKEVFIKISAVIIALLVWGYVITEENPMDTRLVNVALTVNVPVDKHLTEQTANRVAITFEGRIRTLEAIKAEDLVVPIDVSSFPAGKTTVPVEYVSPYPGLTVKDINPPTLTIGLDLRAEKEVAVEVKVNGSPNKEFTADSATYSIASAKVSGPKGNVDRVQKVVGQIDVTGAVGPRTAKVTLSPLDPYGLEVAQVLVDPGDIEVTVPLTARPPSKELPVKVETSGTPKKGYKLIGATVSPNSVEIRGSATITGQLNSLIARVNIDGRDSGFSHAVTLVAPSGVEFETANRVTVNVQIEPDMTSKTFSKVVVQPENLPIEYRWDIRPTQVDVTLGGRSDILDEVKATDVQAFINAGSIDPRSVGERGEFPLPVYLGDLPAGIKVEDISHQSVILVLTKR